MQWISFLVILASLVSGVLATDLLISFDAHKQAQRQVVEKKYLSCLPISTLITQARNNDVASQELLFEKLDKDLLPLHVMKLISPFYFFNVQKLETLPDRELSIFLRLVLAQDNKNGQMDEVILRLRGIFMYNHLKDNSPIAQNNLGMMYAYQSENMELAFYFFECAAQQGNARAQFNLGVLYENGIGTARDILKAFECYRNSAGQEYAKAKFTLGELYENGVGVSRDISKAFEFYRDSAEQGYAKAQYNLGRLYHRGEEGIPINVSKAAALYEQSAKQGYDMAQCNLGIMYEIGVGVRRDIEKAWHWYTQAAKQGHDMAQYNLNRSSYSLFSENRLPIFYGVCPLAAQ